MKAMKKPPVFNQRQGIWSHVLGKMEIQLQYLPPHMADRASEIRRFLTICRRHKDSSALTTVGITIEESDGERYVDVWMSSFGAERPLASIVLPPTAMWIAAHAKYLELVEPMPGPENEEGDDFWI